MHSVIELSAIPRAARTVDYDFLSTMKFKRYASSGGAVARAFNRTALSFRFVVIILTISIIAGAPAAQWRHDRTRYISLEIDRDDYANHTGPR